MLEIKSEKDLVVVPVSYFKGMEQMLEELEGAVDVNTLGTMEKFICLRDWLNPDKVDRETRKMFPNVRWDNIHLLLPKEEKDGCEKVNNARKEMENQRKANKCYLIDEDFCKITQKRIAVVMGKVASTKDSSGAGAEILDELAGIRGFFSRKDLRVYSDKLKDSIDMNRFIHPEKPII